MIKVYENLFVGTESHCTFSPQINWVIIHACKHPCHTKVLNYKHILPQTHPHYLIYENQQNLFLNMVDMEQELLPKFAHPIMKSALRFISKHISDKNVLIHCNQGISRSPSIALVYLARMKHIKNDTYQNASIEFKKLYPPYNPGKGIYLYLNKNWDTVIKQS